MTKWLTPGQWNWEGAVLAVPTGELNGDGWAKNLFGVDWPTTNSTIEAKVKKMGKSGRYAGK
jgi:hypothetical protein